MNIDITLRPVNGKHIPAITSLQVAEIFGKKHSHVLRDIKGVLKQASVFFGESNFGLSEYELKNNLGFLVKHPMYIITKNGFIMLTMGYTGEKAMQFKEAYINRFNEMEKQLANRVPDDPTSLGLPDFQNPALAARAWAEQYERRQIAEAQRDEAIRTKAEIGSRREATSMATASAAVRQRDALADKLGEGKHYKQVKAIPWLLEVFHESAGMYSQVGRKLSDLGARMGLSPRIKEDSQYGTVKIHHVEVIEALRLALKQDHNLLGKYRKMKAA